MVTLRTGPGVTAQHVAQLLRIKHQAGKSHAVFTSGPPCLLWPWLLAYAQQVGFTITNAQWLSWCAFWFFKALLWYHGTWDRVSQSCLGSTDKLFCKIYVNFIEARERQSDRWTDL